jgi:hypothetical protein
MTNKALLIAAIVGLGITSAAASPLIRADAGFGPFMGSQNFVHRVADRCDQKYSACIGGKNYTCFKYGRLDKGGRCVIYAQRCTRSGGTCR